MVSTAVHTAPTAYVHNDNVKVHSSYFITPEQGKFNIKNTYLPQQIINAQHKAKQLPTHMLSFLNKACYLKVLLANSYTELIMQKERSHTALTKETVIRLYRKIEGTNVWQPIASIPESQAQAVFARSLINPNGTINL